MHISLDTQSFLVHNSGGKLLLFFIMLLGELCVIKAEFSGFL